MNDYQWQEQVGKLPTQNLATFSPSFGPLVLERHADGTAKTVEIKVLLPLANQELYLVGNFNGWGQQDPEQYKLQQSDDGYYRIILHDKLRHQDSYLFRTNGEYLRDPGTTYFSENGNSVFWDFKDPKAFKSSYNTINLLAKATKILQSDLPGLIAHYQSQGGKTVSTANKKNYYKYIAESGVISEIQNLGFNAIQFLPVAQSIDGAKWSYRYLVPYIYAINNEWGTPDDFIEMVDTFHKHGIAVILDQVISHAPDRDYQLFDLSAQEIGLQNWDKLTRSHLFLKDETSWGTRRYDYANPQIRQFIVDAAIHYLQNYNIDGFRIDNVDGILRYGDNGDGADRPGGRSLLREFTSKVYSFKPDALVFLESHYYFADNSKMLVAPLDSDARAIGATAYTSSRLTYYLHSEFMPKSADDISPWQIKHILDEEEWGKSNATVADFHNHDAAAGLMPMRATGSYAFDALTLGKPQLHYHAVGKIKVMEAIISFVREGRTLDLLQTHLLQTGTFEHDSSIHWDLRERPESWSVLKYKKVVNDLLENSAFWPTTVAQRKIINLDEASKSIVVWRQDEEGHQYLIIINMSAAEKEQFIVPVPTAGIYEVILNSDNAEFGGTARFEQQEFVSQKVHLFEFFSEGIHLPVLPSYGVIVLELKSFKDR